MQPYILVSARILTITGLLLAAGCADDAGRDAAIFDPIQPKKATVAVTSLDHDIHFTAGARILSASEETSLAGFIKVNAVGADDEVTVGLSAGDSANLAVARQDAVLAALRHLSVKAAPAVNTAVGANAIRLSVARYVVTPPRCPDWSKPEADEPTNSPSSNFGCASETSLALMVANPADLAHGATPGPADGEALARGVAMYRSGAISKSLVSTGGSGRPTGAGASSSGGGQ